MVASKEDPKDTRIAELELALEASNANMTAAETRAQRVQALESEVLNLQSVIANKDKEISAVKGQLEMLTQERSKLARPTVANLDPEKAAQLKISSMVTNHKSKAAVNAVAGEVLVLHSAFDEYSKKLGASVQCHPVSQDEFDAAKRAGRAY
jgi:predicted RNase H-like nuclease (RuvC/YqgF family)